ncbi:MAG: gliding motility protein GldL [Bacteroidetes bacterium]|nr:gliding motility protein GldL [Bacteroidota bacterium]MBL6963064.1 gliding motility protein GldL [Bacteroidota bacterium]
MAKAKKEKKERSGNFFESKAFKSFMAKLYGWGAAVVILGALFKIQHWKGAGLMLTLGLSTEALIFFISAFDKQKEFDWSLVYPELDDEGEGMELKRSVSAEIDKMLEDAKIESHMVSRLGEGMNKFTNTLEGLKEVSNANIATSAYTEKVTAAAENLGVANEAYGKAAEAMSTLSEASGSGKEYFDQLQSASGNLASLNVMYEKEIEETNRHIQGLGEFNSNFSSAMAQLGSATENTQTYFDEISKATQHLTSLNSMYEVELNEQSKHKEALNQYQEKLGDVLGNLSDAGALSIQLNEGFSKLNENLSSLNNVYGNMLSAMAMK